MRRKSEAGVGKGAVKKDRDLSAGRTGEEVKVASGIGLLVSCGTEIEWPLQTKRKKTSISMVYIAVRSYKNYW